MAKAVWRPLTAAILLTGVLVAGCTTQAPPPGPAGASPAAGAAQTQPTPGVKVPDASLRAASPSPQTAAGAVGQPARTGSPSPVAAAPRAEPSGRFIYVWNVAISPAWFDPQENQQLLTPYGFQYAIHDALVKHMPNQPLAPSLAESYEIASDFRSATFRLREEITFHNGDPVTTEDVKWTYENYRGANAKLLKDKTERIETPDARTIRFMFNEPFLDFPLLYGSPASGAGWIVPAKYYQQVGPDGFKRAPIGAGPYKYVRLAGDELELEAFSAYWRKSPSIKTLIMRGVPEATTRLAQIQTGEADVVQSLTGPLLDVAKSDPNLQLAVVRSSAEWLEFTGWEKPDNPFHDVKVRQAASLALDRQAISQAEEGGLSSFEGNWIPENWPGAIQRPMPEFDQDRARQLLAEAGFPNGFDIEQLTPLPPYTALGERVVTQLREVGIRVGRVNAMDRGAFTAKLSEGPDAFGRGIILHFSASPGDAASRIRAFAICGGSTSRTCVPEIDERFRRYEASFDPRERETILNDLQNYILDQYIFVPLYRQSFVSAVGPRMANRWDEVMGAVPQYVYIGPYEDVRLKE
ncbi:MAG TPA: ABC transporter substrate-binding protein [Dehalococcoidia bacterium]|nr:ABC transporter substrate-binding protein [Dehalococcoidia bacterium]